MECTSCNPSTLRGDRKHTFFSHQMSSCPSCGAETSPLFLHSITRETNLHDKTIADIGLPKNEIVWARRDERILGLAISGDTHAQG